MIGASKILTVSYGTFSCTLEGFDDPFNTMRAIAEYFRDLAAEDRYFGAEPPTPDAAMLHRIAEREVQRRVEAKVQENGIVLRASEGNATPASEPAPEPAPAQPAVAPAAAAPLAAAPVAAPVAAAPVAAAPAAPSVAPAATESVAERLLRLRSEVAARQDTPTIPVPGPVSTETVILADYVEDAVEALPPASDTATDSLADLLPEDALPDAAMPEDASQPEAAVQATVEADLALPSEPVHTPAAALPLEAAPVLASILAPVPANPAPQSVDQPAEPILASVLASLDPLPEDEPAAAEPATASDALVEDASDATADLPESLIAALAGPSGHMLDADLPRDIAVSGASIFAEDDSEDYLTAAARMGADDTDEDDDIFAEIDQAEDDDLRAADLAPEIAADLAEAPAKPVAETPLELRPGAADKLQRARARVIRIRRSDAEPEAAAETIAPDATAPATGPLSLEAELDLERALAAADTSVDGTTDEAAAKPQAPAARMTPHPFGDPSAEESVGRLMAQTDTEMEGEETKRRRSAIAHLKAAVAQTVAERRAGEVKPNPEPSRIARYRNDLAMVVRSAMPGGAPTPPKPPGERPAPLVLVSEQRIDRPRPPGGPIPTSATAAPAAAPASVSGQPIRPRRVTTSTGSGLAMKAQDYEESDFDELDLDLEDALSDEPVLGAQSESLADAQSDERGFRDYAATLGATSLREMIEAAAAYLACELGRPHFTRPQLMRQVGYVIPQTDALREDALRIFGTLLRDGYLAKVRRGQFTLTEKSPYHS